MPQLIGDVLEGLRQILRLEREEGQAAGFFREVAQNFVAIRGNARDVGRDGVDHYVGLVRHFERLLARIAALVIVAVAEHDDRAAKFVARLVAHQLVPAGEENRVVERRAAARAASCGWPSRVARVDRSDPPPAPAMYRSSPPWPCPCRGRITVLMKSVAASCWKRKRSRMLLLVSIRMPMRSGRSVSAVNSRCFAASWLRKSRNRLWSRSVTKRPFLSDTVNSRFTRVTSTVMRDAGSSSGGGLGVGGAWAFCPKPAPEHNEIAEKILHDQHSQL